MMPRRSLLVAATCLPLAGQAAALPVPMARRLDFRVVRNGRSIGQHTLGFAVDGARLVVRVEVDLAVGFGPITLYRYRHRATETWQDGRVVAFQAETNDDGTIGTVAMRAQGEVLAVDSSQAGRYLAPPGALPATHWNRRMLDVPFINTQTGEVMRPAIRSAGIGPLPWAQRSQGERLVLSGDVDLETWYDATPAWIGLRFKGSDGSLIHYEMT